MIDAQTMSMTDQLQTAVREEFSERGFDVEVSIAVDDDSEGMQFSVKGKNFTKEFVDEVLEAAVVRIGGKITSKGS
jgi:hypothetical protein